MPDRPSLRYVLRARTGLAARPEDTGTYGIFDYHAKKLVARGLSKDEAQERQRELLAEEGDRQEVFALAAQAEAERRAALSPEERHRENYYAARRAVAKRAINRREGFIRALTRLIDQLEGAAHDARRVHADFLDPTAREQGQPTDAMIARMNADPVIAAQNVGLVIRNMVANLSERELHREAHELAEALRDMDVLDALLGENTESEAARELGLDDRP